MFERKAEWKAHFYCLLIAAAFAVAFFLWSNHDPDVAQLFNTVRWPMVAFLLLAFLLNGTAYFKVRHDPVKHIKKMQSFLKNRL